VTCRQVATARCPSAASQSGQIHVTVTTGVGATVDYIPVWVFVYHATTTPELCNFPATIYSPEQKEMLQKEPISWRKLCQ